MVGSVIAFLTGYCVLFFKEGLLRNIYPYSVALTMIGFDTASYSGTSGKGSVPLGSHPPDSGNPDLPGNHAADHGSADRDVQGTGGCTRTREKELREKRDYPARGPA